MRKAIAATAIAAAAASSACSHSRDEDPGPMTSRSYQVGSFDRVEVAGPFDVRIHTGAAPSVEAKGNQKLIDRLVVEVKNGELRVYPKKKNGWFGGWHNNGEGEVAITVPSLKAATLAGSGGLEIDKIEGDSFDGQIAGSGDFKLHTVNVGHLKLGIAGSGGANAGAGTANRAEYQIAGSGSVDGAGLMAQDLKIGIAGAGDVRAQAKRTAKVDIMGSGNVEITGGAKCEVHKAGSGDVHCS